jgi:hypothetical protein
LTEGVGSLLRRLFRLSAGCPRLIIPEKQTALAAELVGALAMGKEKSSSRARLVFLLWLLVASFYSYLASDYIRAVMRDGEFGDYIEFAVQLVGSQERSGDELLQLVNAKARELSIPLDELVVELHDDEHSIGVIVDYSVEINIPLISKIAYRRDFQHTAAFYNR